MSTAIVDCFLDGASLAHIANLIDTHVTTVEARMREELHALARGETPEPEAAPPSSPKPRNVRRSTKPKAAPVEAAPVAPDIKYEAYPATMQRVNQDPARAVYDALGAMGRATVDQLANRAGVVEDAAWYALNQMRKAGIAAHTDERPYRWALTVRPADEAGR